MISYFYLFVFVFVVVVVCCVHVINQDKPTDKKATGDKSSEKSVDKQSDKSSKTIKTASKEDDVESTLEERESQVDINHQQTNTNTTLYTIISYVIINFSRSFTICTHMLIS